MIIDLWSQTYCPLWLFTTILPSPSGHFFNMDLFSLSLVSHSKNAPRFPSSSTHLTFPFTVKHLFPFPHHPSSAEIFLCQFLSVCKCLSVHWWTSFLPPVWWVSGSAPIFSSCYVSTVIGEDSEVKVYEWKVEIKKIYISADLLPCIPQPCH